MKIEKLNEDKIKITFNRSYLEENHISVHAFMSNSVESQTLFLNLLDAAEKEVGFITDHYKIAIEALTQNKDIFTLIITRFAEHFVPPAKSRLHISRKHSLLEKPVCLYQFANFEAFYHFSKYFTKAFPQIAVLLEKNNSLYEYESRYFLAIYQLSLDKKLLFKITSYLSEFCEYVPISNISFQKLKEFGNLVFEQDAIKLCAFQ